MVDTFENLIANIQPEQEKADKVHYEICQNRDRIRQKLINFNDSTRNSLSNILTSDKYNNSENAMHKEFIYNIQSLNLRFKSVLKRDKISNQVRQVNLDTRFGQNFVFKVPYHVLASKMEVITAIDLLHRYQDRISKILQIQKFIRKLCFKNKLKRLASKARILKFLCIKSFEKKLKLSIKLKIRDVHKIGAFISKTQITKANHKRIKISLNSLEKLMKRLCFNNLTISFFYIRDFSGISQNYANLRLQDENDLDENIRNADTDFNFYKKNFNNEKRNTIFEDESIGQKVIKDSFFEIETMMNKKVSTEESIGNNNLINQRKLDDINALCANINNNMYVDMVNDNKLMDLQEYENNYDMQNSEFMLRQSNVSKSNDVRLEETGEKVDFPKNNLGTSNLSKYYLDDKKFDKNLKTTKTYNNFIENESSQVRKNNERTKNLIEKNYELDKNIKRNKKRNKCIINPKFYGHWHCLMFQNFQQAKRYEGEYVMSNNFRTKLQLAKSLYAWIDNHNIKSI